MATETMKTTASDAQTETPRLPWTSEVAVLLLVGSVFGLIGHLLSSGLSWSLLYWPAFFLTATGGLSLLQPTPRAPERPTPAPPDR